MDVEAGSNELYDPPNHKDFKGRYDWIEEQNENPRDRFLKPRDGRLALLKVQGWGYDESPNQRSWETAAFEDVTPLIIKLVYWITESVPELHTASIAASQRKRYQHRVSRDTTIPQQRSMKEWFKEYSSKRWLILYGRWTIGLIPLLLLLSWPATLDGQIRNGGYYDPVRYRDWRYPKVARNHREDQLGGDGNANQTAEPPADAPGGTTTLKKIPLGGWDRDFDGNPGRHLRPRFLCVMKNYIHGSGSYKPSPLVQEFNRLRPDGVDFEIVSVQDWVEAHDGHANLDYVFVSYTRRQFQTSSAKEMEKWDIESQDKAKMLEIRTEDLFHLCKIGMKAAQDAGVPAFWIDVLCVDPATFPQDVYRICDVVRGAYSMIIALKNSVDNRIKPRRLFSNRDQLLKEWGGRLWTLPEILLCPTDHSMAIHIHGSAEVPKWFTKRSLASLAYYTKDAKAVRQLLDHYEGTLILTSLELITIGLECLQSRIGNTKIFANADLAYALMGLLCRRPRVVKDETIFEAFAKLSLANDSNLILERLICVLPPVHGQPWYKIEDAWDVKLWDIYPTCQISGIGADQTVILDGAYGATIRWKSLKPVAFIRRTTGLRVAIKMYLRGAPLYFFIGVITLATGTRSGIPSSVHYTNPAVVMGALLFTFATIAILASPYLLLAIYRGKFWSTQGWFFGIEGAPDLKTIEKKLFGIDLQRLSWSVNGSLLSQHRVAKNTPNHPALSEECEAFEPAGTAPMKSDDSDNEGPEQVAQDVEQEAEKPQAKREQERIFTLVDTYTMTVTRFRATHPPVAVLICGHEGGMQRAVLCSYNWRSQTFHRETVLRMKTMVLERMFRVDKFRFSMERMSRVDTGQ